MVSRRYTLKNTLEYYNGHILRKVHGWRCFTTTFWLHSSLDSNLFTVVDL